MEPFGSFVSNLFSRWGDLDISIELSNGSYIASAGKKHKQTLLGDVQRALRKNGNFKTWFPNLLYNLWIYFGAGFMNSKKFRLAIHILDSKQSTYSIFGTTLQYFTISFI